MSIRKVSELPYYNIPFEDGNVSKRNQSLMEFSYCVDEVNPYRFQSNYIKFNELLSSINHEIIGKLGHEKSVDFYTSATFKLPVKIEDDLSISGNVDINNGIDYEDYHIIANANSIQINSLDNTVISSDNTYLYQNNSLVIVNNSTSDKKITITTETGKEKIEIKSIDTSITGNVNIRGTLSSTNLTCGDFRCTGTGTFINDIQGCAISARWADLAESYESDFEYKPGTLVKFGGEKEITIADDDVNAVITTKPGFILGSDKQGEIISYIALVGRVPVRVIGPVKKFDKLVLSDIPGVAISKRIKDNGLVIGVALESIDTEINQENLIETVVKISF